MQNDTIIPLIGLDTAKNIHVFGVYSSEGLAPMTETVEAFNNRIGFEMFTGYLDPLLEAYLLVRLGNEPTGRYYEAWCREVLTRYADDIASGHLDYRLVMPNLVKESRQALLRGRCRKTDAIDTQAIARCLLLGEGTPAYLPDGQYARFYLWTAHYRQLHHERARLGMRIMEHMDRLWPGAFVNVKRFQQAHPGLELPAPLVTTRPLERQMVQALLTHCPNPHDVLRLSEADMIAFLRKRVGRGGPQTAGRILRCAANALLPPPEIAAIYVGYLADDWERYQMLSGQIASLETEIKQLVPHSPAAVLVTVPGVSAIHAARYVAYVQDPRRFLSADHVWSFAGFDPMTTQSGDVNRIGKLSKRGDRGFRDVLFLIGRHTGTHCPPIAQTFQRARRRFSSDKNAIRATIHAARKANRLLYRLLLDQVPYDPARHG